MKITKPKANQILIEDDILKKYDLKVKTKGGLNKSKYNLPYEGLILVYRLPGMDSSKQIFYGNMVSINTLLASSLNNLVKLKMVDIDTLLEVTKDGKF